MSETDRIGRGLQAATLVSVVATAGGGGMHLGTVTGDLRVLQEQIQSLERRLGESAGTSMAVGELRTRIGVLENIDERLRELEDRLTRIEERQQFRKGR